MVTQRAHSGYITATDPQRNIYVSRKNCFMYGSNGEKLNQSLTVSPENQYKKEISGSMFSVSGLGLR